MLNLTERQRRDALAIIENMQASIATINACFAEAKHAADKFRASATVTCPRCKVTVPLKDVSLPDRCPDRLCPLNKGSAQC